MLLIRTPKRAGVCTVIQFDHEETARYREVLDEHEVQIYGRYNIETDGQSGDAYRIVVSPTGYITMKGNPWPVVNFERTVVYPVLQYPARQTGFYISPFSLPFSSEFKGERYPSAAIAAGNNAREDPFLPVLISETSLDRAFSLEKAYFAVGPVEFELTINDVTNFASTSRETDETVFVAKYDFRTGQFATRFAIREKGDPRYENPTDEIPEDSLSDHGIDRLIFQTTVKYDLETQSLRITGNMFIYGDDENEPWRNFRTRHGESAPLVGAVLAFKN